MNKNTLNFGVGETEHAVRDRLLGTWKLIATEETVKDGSTRPFPQFRPNAKGFLTYQADGHMCALLVNPDQPKSTVAIEKTLNKKAASFDAAFAYCGRYEIDAGQKHIVHLPEVATHPGYVGSRQVRPYEFDGNRLILSDIEKEDPTVVRWKIVWEKMQ